MPIYVMNEAREAPLYHTTTVESALAILKSGVLKPSVPYHDNQVPSNVQGQSCVCFTRSKDYRLTNLTFIQFVFDQAKLDQNYKMASIANVRGDSNSISGFAGTNEPHNAKTFEYEERVLTDKPIPLDKYLLDIRILDGRLARRSIERVLDGSVNDEMYELYAMSKSSKLPFYGFTEYFNKVKSEYGSTNLIEPIYNYNPRIEITDRLDYRYSDRVKAYVPEDEYSYLTKYNNIVLSSSIHDVLDSDTRIPNLTIEELKPHIVDIQFSSRVKEDFIQSVYEKVRNSDITEVDHLMYDAGQDYSGDKKGIARLVAMIYGLGLPCKLLESSSEEESEPIMDTTLNSNENKSYHPDIAEIMSVVSDRVTVKLTNDVIAEFKIAEEYRKVTGVIVRRPGKKAQVYGGSKAIPPYYRKMIDTGVITEIYNDMFQEEVVEPIDMEDDNVKFYVSFEGRDVVIEAEILVNNSVKYDLVRDYLVNVLGMDGDFVKRTTTISAPNRDLWIGRINSYFEQIQAKIDEYVPVVDEIRDTVGLIMQDLIKPKGFNIIEVSDDSIKAEINVGNAKITVDMDAHDADIYVAGIKLSDYPDLVADMNNAGYTDIREYTDDSIKIMESISATEDTEEFANRISELLDMITNGVANAPAVGEESPKNGPSYTRSELEAMSTSRLRIIQRELGIYGAGDRYMMIGNILKKLGVTDDEEVFTRLVQAVQHKCDQLQYSVDIEGNTIQCTEGAVSMYIDAKSGTVEFTPSRTDVLDALVEEGYVQEESDIVFITKSKNYGTIEDYVDKLFTVAEHFLNTETRVLDELHPDDIPLIEEEDEELPEEGSAGVGDSADDEYFLQILDARRDFKKVDDYKFRYVESDDDYDFEVEFDNEYDVVYFIVHCADVKDTEFINRVMGNAYKFSGYTGQSIMTLQLDLGDLDKMIDSQVKKFNILVDETLAQSQAKSDHAISAELVAKPQQDPEQERAAKRLEKFVRTVLAPIVDSDPEWNSFFIDTPKEFKRYRLRTVGIMLTCYDMKSTATKLKSNPLFKKMSKAKKVVIQRGWQKALDPDGNKCWMCIFIDAEYAKEYGRELLEEKVSYQGKDYMVIDIQDNLAILEGTDRIRVISTGTLLDL